MARRKAVFIKSDAWKAVKLAITLKEIEEGEDVRKMSLSERSRSPRRKKWTDTYLVEELNKRLEERGFERKVDRSSITKLKSGNRKERPIEQIYALADLLGMNPLYQYSDL